MQSSTGVAGRALIMLLCVVGIPAWALSGASWSDVVKKLQDFRLPAILNPAAASTSITVAEAPRFVPSKPTNVSAVSHSSAPLAEIKPISPAPAAPAKVMEAPPTSAVVPVAYQAAASAQLTPIPQPANSGTDASALSADPFQAIPKRLRELGATYYLLESWGSDQQTYRFFCKMAVGGSADYTRHFEACHSDPHQAMHQVLQQVELWRSGGRVEDVGLRN